MAQGQDEFAHFAFVQAGQQAIHLQGFGGAVIQRGQQAAQYEILTFVKVAFLQGKHTVPLGHQTQRVSGAFGIGAHRTGVGVG